MLSSNAYAQKGTKMKKGNVVDSKGVRSAGGEKGADPNIKSTDLTRNDAAAKGSGARGAAVCGVFWDNYTNLYIKVFVDGEYEGTVAPMGELQTYAIAGGTRLYARADYTDGSSVYWGPDTFSCNAGTNYTRKLR